MQLMVEVVSFEIHYGGHWNKNDDQNWRYEGGGIRYIQNQDIDYLSYHEQPLGIVGFYCWEN